MELRMYGLTNYQLTGIQKGIQFLHGVVEYGQKVKENGNEIALAIYNDWANNHKTVILLNGGTTNHRTNIEDGLPFGSLNQHLLKLLENNIDFAQFNEPDLGDQLTSIVFIVDERVFNKKKYPDFEDWLVINYGDLIDTQSNNSYSIAQRVKISNEPQDKKAYEKWLNFIGGEKNEFLRDFLRNFRLA